ncbi:hypothetical protein NDU88_001965 [Pleurodeles waltl]|uniref:Uncharacterized protein n=1 Tax=Pleurodeles waltl TaxID=8319 RepID=A0AAV7VB60_PLEWA|nr:hypothetical protein NDU88_001965 [Pleurodeles waltl]
MVQRILLLPVRLVSTPEDFAHLGPGTSIALSVHCGLPAHLTPHPRVRGGLRRGGRPYYGSLGAGWATGDTPLRRLRPGQRVPARGLEFLPRLSLTARGSLLAASSPLRRVSGDPFFQAARTPRLPGRRHQVCARCSPGHQEPRSWVRVAPPHQSTGARAPRLSAGSSSFFTVPRIQGSRVRGQAAQYQPPRGGPAPKAILVFWPRRTNGPDPTAAHLNGTPVGWGNRRDSRRSTAKSSNRVYGPVPILIHCPDEGGLRNHDYIKLLHVHRNARQQRQRLGNGQVLMQAY